MNGPVLPGDGIAGWDVTSHDRARAEGRPGADPHAAEHDRARSQRRSLLDDGPWSALHPETELTVLDADRPSASTAS
jgi:hypothetical protein